ncbi:SusD/RagB family nutrient-binding outer membrane lipoprotein [Agriterribacter sp.]|uniref:SusD/RagB family nutrient-binding outer membrane lipoprotein n=1 Tax=Agriterribacter sp. TaxID=2821509 RepID=UPI002B7AB320|nr:SusD/RagB family nutrient-binding outer membrane lipoprotein [Agriterribacter sp.]HRO47117.1 SusD/RagB family nutrient-binding outer membrane lipoprotein [Agriterribacter sp.]HRQ17874.1 SusD/RagB family nutrient-binding outer membrane lipoprotein [Agriterribacter sp.]
MLKYIYNSVWIIILFLTFTSCTKNFRDINIDPTKLTDLESESLFTQAIIQTSGGEYESFRGNLIYTTQFVQQFASTTYQAGDRYLFDEGYNSALWDGYYGKAIQNLVNLIEKTAGKEEEINYHSASKVLKAFIFLRLTDIYGNLPYFNAGKGFLNGIFTPDYDEQRIVLLDIADELEVAAKSFRTDKPLKGDITSYNGNVELWKKAAYSLLLRVGMRFSKIDPTTATSLVSKAYTNGLISSNDETFRINHTSGVYDNPNSHILGFYPGSRSELYQNNFKFSKTFIDILKLNNDVRLKILSVIRTGGSPTDPGNENDDTFIQKGLPNGTDISHVAGSLHTFSQLRSSFADANDPNVIVSYAQTMLLLAEAREKNWIQTGPSGEFYYRKGVQAAIDLLRLYNPSSSIFESEKIETFLTGLVYPNNLEERLESINTQYYIASLLDGYEAHANWRRSNYPTLIPVNFPGNYTGGVIPRRFQYPASEGALNTNNLDAAISKQGSNNWLTNVWWDK